MTDILPAGNVAHGIAYNYVAGFLNPVLPGKLCFYYLYHITYLFFSESVAREPSLV